MMSVYEIRLHRPDGALSIVMKAMAVGDIDAKCQARTMLRSGISNAHIWRDDDLIGSLYATDWPDTANVAAYRVLLHRRQFG